MSKKRLTAGRFAKIKAVIELKPTAKNREIGEFMGVSESTVGRVRKFETFEEMREVMGKYNREHTSKKPYEFKFKITPPEHPPVIEHKEEVNSTDLNEPEQLPLNSEAARLERIEKKLNEVLNLLLATRDEQLPPEEVLSS